jgi:RND family efflux transporter MFP subunit
MFLTSPVAPGVYVEVPIETIRPQVGSMSRALVVLASVTNPGPWKPGATIEARVIIDRRPNAVVVPSIAVVRRPAGEVVYVLDDPASRQVSERVVTVGQRKNGLLEITAGLEPGTVIVADGAPYLSDGALVTVRDAQP